MLVLMGVPVGVGALNIHQQATLKVMVCMELFVQTSTSKYAAPKPIRSKIIQIAKSFLTPVPSFPKQKREGQVFYQLTCLDLLNLKQSIPPSETDRISLLCFEKPTPSRENGKEVKGEAAENLTHLKV